MFIEQIVKRFMDQMALLDQSRRCKALNLRHAVLPHLICVF